MIVDRDELVHYIDNFLMCDKFKDSALQGMQVQGKRQVQKIVTAVSVSLQLFEQARINKADMIIVHHGLFWQRENRVIKGVLKNRLKSLLSSDMTLAAYHLPLDAHPKIGNNAIAARLLNLKKTAMLGDIGVCGSIEQLSLEKLLIKLKEIYHTDQVVFAYGPEKIRTVGFCSGEAARDIVHAIDMQCDAFITGTADEPTPHLAKESGIHFIAVGHYASEKAGIQALGRHIASRFHVDVQFIDIPNPI